MYFCTWRGWWSCQLIQFLQLYHLSHLFPLPLSALSAMSYYQGVLMADYSAFTNRMTEVLMAKVLQEKDPVAHAIGNAIPELINLEVESKRTANKTEAVIGLAKAVDILEDLGYAKDSDEVKALTAFFGITEKP